MSIPSHDRLPPIPKAQWTEAQQDAAARFAVTTP